MRLAAAVIGALLPTLFHPVLPSVVTTTYGLGEWRLIVQRDTFAHQLSCQIENRNGFHPDIIVANGAVQFRLSQDVDTHDAWYQLDGQPPRLARDLYAQLLHQGALNDLDSLDGGAQGDITLPISILRNTKIVKIRASSNSNIQLFKLDHLSYLFDSGLGAGCGFHVS